MINNELIHDFLNSNRCSERVTTCIKPIMGRICLILLYAVVDITYQYTRDTKTFMFVSFTLHFVHAIRSAFSTQSF